MKASSALALVLLLFCHSETYAQNEESGWQWAKRGSGDGSFTTGTPTQPHHFQRIIDIAVDSDNNYYFLAQISGTSSSSLTDFDGMPLSTYNDNPSRSDIYLVSTDSEGNFRWDKMIGGGVSDFGASVNVDENDNVYLSGTVNNVTISSSSQYSTHVHFDTDTVMIGGDPQMPDPANKSVFIIKYDQEGNYHWLQQPEGANIAKISGVVSLQVGKLLNTVIEPDGTTHSLIDFMGGDHLNGQLTVPELQRQTAIVKYDSSGDLTDFFTVDMKPLSGALRDVYAMAYDPNSDRYYLADHWRQYDTILSINDHQVDAENGLYIAAINNQGQTDWVITKEKRHGNVGAIELDEEGNIYFSGEFNGEGISGSGVQYLPDGFNGFSFINLPTYGGRGTFLTKLAPDGTNLWTSHSSATAQVTYNGEAVAVDGNNAYLGFGSVRNVWGDISVPGTFWTGMTPSISIIRFDAETGEAQEVYHNTVPTSTRDMIMALEADHDHNLVLGGHFGSALFQNSDLAMTGQAQSDFFIAKYATRELPCLAPNAFAVEKLSGASAKISWTPRQGEDQWEIIYGNEPVLPGRTRPEFGPYDGEGTTVVVEGTPEVVLTGLDSTKYYAYFVRAICDDEHHSPWPSPDYFKLDDFPPSCDTPSNLTLEEGDESDAILSWWPGGSEQQWQSAVGFQGFNPDSEGLKGWTSRGLEFHFKNLDECPNYEFYVRAACDWGEFSDWAGPLSLSAAGIPPCMPPVEGVVQSIGGVQAEISWSDEGGEQWEVRYGVLGFDVFSEGVVQVTDVPQITLENLNENTDYEVHVRAICNESCNSEWMEVLQFSTAPLSASNVEPEDIVVYPNPTSNTVCVKSDQALKRCFIHDIYGRRVLSNTFQSGNLIDLSRLAPGTYILFIEVGNGATVSRKISKL